MYLRYLHYLHIKKGLRGCWICHRGEQSEDCAEHGSMVVSAVRVYGLCKEWLNGESYGLSGGDS